MVSEFMLQQTPVNRVLPVWQEWLTRWPTPKDLSSAKKSEVIIAWGRLGYPRRALRLLESATIIATAFNNEVPCESEKLLALPGVGEYTAAAISAFAFNQPALVLDINIRRLLARAVDGQSQPTPAPSQWERKTRAQLIPLDGAKWAAATMELGALICTSQNPHCEICPIKRQCAWRKAGYPKSEFARRSQTWDGTDRQCRGTIVQALRENKKLNMSKIQQLWSDEVQVEKALMTLIADGLIETIGKSFQLPD